MEAIKVKVTVAFSENKEEIARETRETDEWKKGEGKANQTGGHRENRDSFVPPLSPVHHVLAVFVTFVAFCCQFPYVHF